MITKEYLMINKEYLMINKENLWLKVSLMLFSLQSDTAELNIN